MTVPGIIMTCLFGAFIVMGLLSSRMERQQKQLGEERKAKEQDTEKNKNQEEAQFISTVTNLLPDTDAAIKQLMTRHSWDELIGTIGLSKLHLTLLKNVRFKNQVDLPNMQAAHYGREENHVANVARRTTSSYIDIGSYGVDLFAQEPTVELLRNLVSSDLVSTSVPITQNQRSFVCKLTPKGQSVLALNSRFENIDKSFRLRHVLSEEERKLITTVLYKSIFVGVTD